MGTALHLFFSVANEIFELDKVTTRTSSIGTDIVIGLLVNTSVIFEPNLSP